MSFSLPIAQVTIMTNDMLTELQKTVPFFGLGATRALEEIVFPMIRFVVCEQIVRSLGSPITIRFFALQLNRIPQRELVSCKWGD